MDHDITATSTASDVLSAYERFRSADAALQTRIRNVTGMGDNELRLVRYLLKAQHDGVEVKPGEIARFLGISSASTTALLDRLERGGALERLSNPTDRRSILISPTPTAEAALASTVQEHERRLARLADSLDDDARRTIVEFLDALAETANGVAKPDAAP